MPTKTTPNEQLINHYGAIRLRVTGSANLQMTLLSLDETESFVMTPLPIQTVTAVEPNRLSNFTQQRAKLLIQTTEINENFLISRIVIFTVPVANSWPETV